MRPTIVSCEWRLLPVEIEAYCANQVVVTESGGLPVGTIRYAVRRRPLSHYCLNKAGEWEYEPSPSSRDDAFIARCRWDVWQDAVDAGLVAAQVILDDLEARGWVKDGRWTGAHA